MKTRVLALNAYHGGSHRAFLDGWMRHSRHAFDVFSLPAYKWKWRMRHAAVTFAEQTALRDTDHWSVLFCTDMLNLAEFLGLASQEIRDLPAIVYFHENQLTYPNRRQDPRDLHFAFTNFTTALAADAVWFNSQYHRDEFLQAAQAWMRRMPDFRPLEAIAAIQRKSAVYPLGVDAFPPRGRREPGPLRIAWVGRWEHDKDPETFFASLRRFRATGGEFRLTVLGESFGDAPPCFETARREFADSIDHWGYLEGIDDYRAALTKSDVVLSTARHEFFGIGVLEAVAAGCFPLLPRGLAYPEVFGNHDRFFHDGSADQIAACLRELASRAARNSLWSDELQPDKIVERYYWPRIADRLDGGLAKLAAPSVTG